MGYWLSFAQGLAKSSARRAHNVTYIAKAGLWVESIRSMIVKQHWFNILL